MVCVLTNETQNSFLVYSHTRNYNQQFRHIKFSFFFYLIYRSACSGWSKHITLLFGSDLETRHHNYLTRNNQKLENNLSNTPKCTVLWHSTNVLILLIVSLNNWCVTQFLLPLYHNWLPSKGWSDPAVVQCTLSFQSGIKH